MLHRFITNIVTGLTIMAMSVGAFSPTARAVTVVTESVKIEGGTADFGSGLHALGTPTGDGSVKWDFTTDGSGLKATVRVQGTLYLDSVDPGCARVTIEFKSSSDGSGPALATRHTDVCVTTAGHNANDSTNKKLVDESFSSCDLNSVVLQTNPVVNGQPVSPGSHKLFSQAPNKRKLSVKVNSNDADFGTGTHAGGGPTGDGLVQFTRENCNVTGLVSGTLYYDSLFSEGCAQIIIDFENSSGTALKSQTIKKCGPGGNANDAVNKKTVDETFNGASLSKIRLRVGQVLPDGSFVRVQSKTCDLAQCN